MAEEISSEIQKWVKKLSNEDMPVVANTVGAIADLVEDESSSAKLAEVILQDPSLTARVLKLANSSFYNPARRIISTVSRAIVMLGFDVVYRMCISLVMIDNLLKGPHKEHMLEEMARAFHAGVQAKSFTTLNKDPAPEEVFIAALLYRVGNMAFWSFSKETGLKLHEALKKFEGPSEEVEKEILGFSLKDLTAALNKEWRMSVLLAKAADGKSSDPRARYVVLAHELATKAEEGWNSPEMEEHLIKIAKAIQQPIDKVRSTVYQGAREANHTASSYGAADAAELIPLPSLRTGEVDDYTEEQEEPQEESEFPKSNPALQLMILREISSSLFDAQTNTGLNLLVEMAMEGVFRGIGMDRSLFALLTLDRHTLKGKYALGWGRQDFAQEFVFPTFTPTQNIFAQCILNNKPVWYKHDDNKNMEILITDEVKAVTHESAFFAMPVSIGKRVIGLLYADRQLSGRPLTEEDYRSFVHFGQQTNLGLTIINQRTEAKR